MPKQIIYIAGGLLLLVLIGGIGYKIVAPTSKTVIEKGGKQVIVNTDPPSVPLLRGGCGIYRLKMDQILKWEKGFNLDQPKKEEK